MGEKQKANACRFLEAYTQEQGNAKDQVGDKLRDGKVNHAVNIGSNPPFSCSLYFIKLPACFLCSQYLVVLNGLLSLAVAKISWRKTCLFIMIP